MQERKKELKFYTIPFLFIVFNFLFLPGYRCVQSIVIQKFMVQTVAWVVIVGLSQCCLMGKEDVSMKPWLEKGEYFSSKLGIWVPCSISPLTSKMPEEGQKWLQEQWELESKVRMCSLHLARGIWELEFQFSSWRLSLEPRVGNGSCCVKVRNSENLLNMYMVRLWILSLK